MRRAWQRWHSLDVLRGLTRLVKIPRCQALNLVKLKILPFIQKARLTFPRWLYFPFSGRRFPRCSKTSKEAPCETANWTMRALTRWAICSSARRILRQRSTLSCSPSALNGEVKVFSMGVCSHHFCPRRTREGLPITYPSGRSRESVRTLIQLQHVPVQTLSMMDDPLRSFHIPA